MDLVALQATLRQFAAEREWAGFHTPKNLAMALMVEAAELAEIFQWMTPEQSQTAHSDVVLRDRIADEVVDVLLYLLQIADHTGVDLKRSVGRKLVKNAKKHPPTRPGAAMALTPRLGAQTHVLVDWENVQPKDTDIRALVPQVSDVWLFRGPQQKIAASQHASFGERCTLVPIARTGANALDFHLSFYMGYIASRNPQASFVVISNDKGYGPMLEHAASLGFAASQLSFGKPEARPKKAPAKKAAPAKKKASVAAKPASAPVSVPRKTLLQAEQHVLASLKKTSSRPSKQAKLITTIKALLGTGTDAGRVQTVLGRLLAGGKVEVDAKGGVTYNFT